MKSLFNFICVGMTLSALAVPASSASMPQSVRITMPMMRTLGPGLQCLTLVENNNVEPRPCAPFATEAAKFQIFYAQKQAGGNHQGEVYGFVNVKTGKCLDAGLKEGAELLAWQCHGGTNQLFRAGQARTPESPVGYYYNLRPLHLTFASQYDMPCVDVWADANGTNTTIRKCSGEAKQKVDFVAAESI